MSAGPPVRQWSFNAKLAALQFEWSMLRREHEHVQAHTDELMQLGDLEVIGRHVDTIVIHRFRLRLFATALAGFVKQYGGGWTGLPAATEL